jgi:hypothetical protein
MTDKTTAAGSGDDVRDENGRVLKRIERYGPEWSRLANQAARAFVRIATCRHCTRPNVYGYCCQHCGSTDP